MSTEKDTIAAIKDRALLHEISKYCFLYNPECAFHKSNRERGKAWAAIASKLNTSQTSCKKRWQKAKDCYNRHKKILKGATGSVPLKYIPNPIIQHMSFMDTTEVKKDISSDNQTTPSQDTNMTDESSNFNGENKLFIGTIDHTPMPQSSDYEQVDDQNSIVSQSNPQPDINPNPATDHEAPRIATNSGFGIGHESSQNLVNNGSGIGSGSSQFLTNNDSGIGSESSQFSTNNDPGIGYGSSQFLTNNDSGIGSGSSLFLNNNDSGFGHGSSQFLVNNDSGIGHGSSQFLNNNDSGIGDGSSQFLNNNDSGIGEGTSQNLVNSNSYVRHETLLQPPTKKKKKNCSVFGSTTYRLQKLEKEKDNLLEIVKALVHPTATSTASPSAHDTEVDLFFRGIASTVRKLPRPIIFQVISSILSTITRAESEVCSLGQSE
ncbi:hypothetical protein BC332_34413 [Capsicum chinense]|uniref:MADF domain-containing protein n=1 Tax=Bemisia tabaci TaxID=7038 RepID=A0A9P0F961_BEMTA|nr:hypothetical protein BC332_34413 [Capsicum chinense]CAH0393297.1 unnamed protein product [Bemisia tabaci]